MEMPQQLNFKVHMLDNTPVWPELVGANTIKSRLSEVAIVKDMKGRPGAALKVELANGRFAVVDLDNSALQDLNLQSMMHGTDILNIDFNVRRLVVIALNKFDTHEKAADALGISTRCLHNYKRDFDIGFAGGKYKVVKGSLIGNR